MYFIAYCFYITKNYLLFICSCVDNFVDNLLITLRFMFFSLSLGFLGPDVSGQSSPVLKMKNPVQKHFGVIPEYPLG